MYVGARSIMEGGERLTEILCWSRMQAEGGQDLRSIVLRKELERSAGDGIFCWGVGNAPARAVTAYARACIELDVVFSVMKTRPKPEDAAPSKLVIWRSYYDHDGKERSLPAASLVTSRAESETRLKGTHYALMCRADTALDLGDFGSFDPSAYRNASEFAGAVGASQTTALLRRVTVERKDAAYRINLRARLTKGYWVKLGDPMDLSPSKHTALHRELSKIGSLTTADWLELVSKLREGSGRRPVATLRQSSLF
jgi:hypothetical protein